MPVRPLPGRRLALTAIRSLLCPLHTSPYEIFGFDTPLVKRPKLKPSFVSELLASLKLLGFGKLCERSCRCHHKNGDNHRPLDHGSPPLSPKVLEPIRR